MTLCHKHRVFYFQEYLNCIIFDTGYGRLQEG